MTAQSLSYRLRLSILSLSLFCFGAAASFQLLCTIAWASGAVPQTVSSSPDIEVVSRKWAMYVLKPGIPTGPAIGSETIEKSENINRPIPVDPIPVQVPNPNMSAKPIEHPYFMYSTEIRNRGQKDIKALKWSYVFSDPVTHEELKRQRGFGDVTIHPAKKKTLEIRTTSSPPRVVNANSPNAASPFEERVVIECVVFADGSLWTNPQAKEGLCDNLRGYKR